MFRNDFLSVWLTVVQKLEPLEVGALEVGPLEAEVVLLGLQ